MVTGYSLRVKGYRLRVTGYGMEVGHTPQSLRNSSPNLGEQRKV